MSRAYIIYEAKGTGNVTITEINMSPFMDKQIQAAGAKVTYTVSERADLDALSAKIQEMFSPHMPAISFRGSSGGLLVAKLQSSAPAPVIVFYVTAEGESLTGSTWSHDMCKEWLNGLEGDYADANYSDIDDDDVDFSEADDNGIEIEYDDDEEEDDDWDEDDE